MTLINLFTDWYFIALVFLLNTVGAVLLKSALMTTVKENPWLKYVFLVPPASLLCWLMALVISFYGWLKTIAVNYFRD